ncbi:MAG: winged helix-turn-helix domain-containing protein [Bacteroidales bacterium]|nr:winged helix-turn-helix domain-containing protein [Bacteroidales bacterium]
MLLRKKNTSLAWFNLLAIVATVSLLALQALWLYNAYKLTYNQLIIDIDNAFEHACRNEQVYRMPLGNLFNDGNLTIQSCGKEKIMIIRDCEPSDTLVYDNVYGLSMEVFMNKAFYELRERTLPMNIHCLSDLFAGALHEKGIRLSFVIERFNPTTNEVLESSLPGDEFFSSLETHVTMMNVSETDGVRARLQFSRSEVFRQMGGLLIGSLFLLLLIFLCLILRQQLLRRQAAKYRLAKLAPYPVVEGIHHHKIYTIGKYSFNVDKNELAGFGQCINLNKKEQAILEALCIGHGNVVERVKLLEDNWGSTGFIYSRSLDTYITTLRKYLKDDPTVQIITIKGLGYKLSIG